MSTDFVAGNDNNEPTNNSTHMTGAPSDASNASLNESLTPLGTFAPLPDADGMTQPDRSHSPSRTPTSAEIDAVIAAAIANAPPALAPPEIDRSSTPLMTNLLPSAVGIDGRVNLFVGNLPYRVRWQDLKDLFRKAGTVLRADVSLGPDNRSRGYGTVLMGSREDAARAIDRFNGFTWQTRTLEVRPDRLPPEYEPQPHPAQQHPQQRPPLFNYNSMPNQHPHQNSHFGAPHHGPNWLPPHFNARPPPNSHAMHHHFSLPNHMQHPGAHPMSLAGTSPIPTSSSPAPGFAPPGHATALSSHITGNNFQAFGASPLAGSLTGGPVPRGPLGHNGPPGEGLSNVNLAMSPDPLANGQNTMARPSSPVRNQSGSRPSSSNAGNASPPKPDGTSRARPGSLGTLPPPAFAGARPVPATDDGSALSDTTPPIPPKTLNPAAPVAIAMEGLSHQKQHMGPPSTLHDRVVFVSNLPLSMQWQELKDLLRPAGLIIRADVAQDGEGRPRGFGTALFATEQDAAKAVNMYNDREVTGHRIRVSLERVSISETISRRGSSNTSALGFGETSSPPQSISTSTDLSSQPPTQSTSSPIGGRVPWGLNTGIDGAQSTPSRPSATSSDDTATPQQTYRHHGPGPISMPVFAPLDTPGHNPLSPLQTRGFPPMTPSMPGFVFNAYPETPPVHHGFMSMGPFSPGIPVTSPTGFQYNPFLNAAPGAPVNRYPQGGSAALGTPTTTVFPNNPIHGYRATPGSGVPGQRPTPSIGQIGDYFPTFNQNGFSGDLGSPSSRMSVSRQGPAPSPLNAKDRLASTAEEVNPNVTASGDVAGLTQGTASMSLESQPGLPTADSSRSVGSGTNTGPPSPTGRGVNKDLSTLMKAMPMQAADSISSTIPNGAQSRASLDGRPNLNVWDTALTERRASFGDVVAGRNKESS